MTLVTRSAVAADADGIASLLRQGDQHHAALLAEFFTLPNRVSRSAESILSIIAGSESDYLVAEDEQALIGVASVRVGTVSPESTVIARSSVVLDHMVVAESHRRMSVGAALLRHAQQWAREHAQQRIQITVWSANREAVEFYQGHGFREISRKM